MMNFQLRVWPCLYTDQKGFGYAHPVGAEQLPRKQPRSETTSRHVYIHLSQTTSNCAETINFAPTGNP